MTYALEAQGIYFAKCDTHITKTFYVYILKFIFLFLVFFTC
jgi:hypothetical protein